MLEITIDKEFQTLNRKLTKEEHDWLREQIANDGCLDPLKLWDCEGKLLLLDGHNRLGICKELNKPFKTSILHFDSRPDAIIWIIKHQLGKRNITESQASYLRGKIKEQEGLKRGRPSINDTEEDKSATKMAHREPPPTKSNKKIASETGVSVATIKRDAEFSKAIDLIKDASPELAQNILSENIKPSREVVSAISKLPTEERVAVSAEMLEAIAKKPGEERDAFKEIRENLIKHGMPKEQPSGTVFCSLDYEYRCKKCDCEWEMTKTIFKPVTCPGCAADPSFIEKVVKQ